MKRKHPFRRIMIGVAATASGVVLLLALKQPGGSSVASATGAADAVGAARPGGGVAASAGAAGTGAPGAGASGAGASGAGASGAGASEAGAGAAAPGKNAGADPGTGGTAGTDPGTGTGTGAGTGGGGGTGTGGGTGGGGGGGGGARSVLGNAVDTQYGPVQVRITLSGGRITAAEAVQSPDGGISANAVPRLNQAAVTAQSARIDAVSGASYTSEGYQDSLQSALDKAGV